MRSEDEMFNLILDTARQDERIRAVILNGSRANPHAPKDFFQDFDVIYLVTDVEPFRRNLTWIERFGERMILQLPDDMADPPPIDGPGYTYLMQFADGNRIDLNCYPVSRLAEMEKDSLTVVLLDKDGMLPPYPPPDESEYLPKPPTAKAFADCTNEFWWVSAYVAKSLWRGEIILALYIYNEYVREELTKMLVWYIGMKTRFSVNPGKYGKKFQTYLETPLWDMLLRTYSGADYDRTWEALSVMGDLFRITALQIAGHFGFEYPYGDDQRVSAHLRHVRLLPRDELDMYE